MEPFAERELRVPNLQWPWWYRWLGWLFGPAFPGTPGPAGPASPGGFEQPDAMPAPWPGAYRPVPGADPPAAPRFGSPQAGFGIRKPLVIEPRPDDGDDDSRTPAVPALVTGRGIFIALALIILFFYFSAILNTPAGIGGNW